METVKVLYLKKKWMGSHWEVELTKEIGENTSISKYSINVDDDNLEWYVSFQYEWEVLKPYYNEIKKQIEQLKLRSLMK